MSTTSIHFSGYLGPSVAQHKHAVIRLRINLHRQITDPRAGRLYYVLSVTLGYNQTNMDFYYNILI